MRTDDRLSYFVFTISIMIQQSLSTRYIYKKALLTLGKNSVSILFTRSQAVQPLDTLIYHIFTVYVCSKPFIIIIIIITFQLATKENAW